MQVFEIFLGIECEEVNQSVGMQSIVRLFVTVFRLKFYVDVAELMMSIVQIFTWKAMVFRLLKLTTLRDRHT